MAKVIVFGLAGEEKLYVADIDAGTVQPFDAAASGALVGAAELRSAGATVTKGVDLAVAVSSSASAFSGVFD
jgi:hypothetical protein